MLQNFQKKRNKKKHAYVEEPTDRAELLNFCYCRVLKNVENVAEL